MWQKFFKILVQKYRIFGLKSRNFYLFYEILLLDKFKVADL